MLNRIWFLLLLVGILYGFAKGAVGSYRLATGEVAVTLATTDDAEQLAIETPLTLVEAGKQLNKAAIDAAELSVEICIGLIGIMALWLGLLKVAEDAGLVASLARMLRPVMRWLFPGVPDGHPSTLR